MQDSRVVLGIDGGGTKTATVVMDLTGIVRGRTVAGSTNWNSVGEERARLHLQQAVQSVLYESGCSAQDLAAICMCAAGVDRPDDRRRVTTWLQELAPAASIMVHNDAIAALASGTGGEIYGVVLISGTGMIVYGYDRGGNSARAGGWGALLGDPGSGYALAMDALAAITWAADGRGPQTGLTTAVLAELGLSSPRDLIGWTYADYSWDRFARLAPVVIECADAGDEVAQKILEEGADGMAGAVKSVVQQLALDDTGFPLVLAGGALSPGPYANLVEDILFKIAPTAEIVYPELEPADGAALLALKRI